ncbi:MAG TPA: methyltransferase, partial [Bryobacteraceae bacterium]|nr:methyltransferase [Bryobacteraceae bacterium]
MSSAPQQSSVTPEKIMRYTWGYAPPLIIEAAIRNGFFDALKDGSKTAAQVSTATGASLRGVASILNALTGLELLDKNGESYSLTPDSRAFLVKGAPGYLGGMIEHMSSQLIPKWLDIADIVRAGHPTGGVNSVAEGTAFFEKLVPALFPFNYGAASAAGETLGVANATAPVRVLDLAAGSGVWGIAIAQKSPQVEVTAIDWPGVLEITRKTAAQFGLANRFSFIAGDLGEVNFGRGYNIATLGHILHSEGVERSKALLRKTFDALAPGGTIVIAEFLVDPERKTSTMGLIFDVNMLVNTERGATYSFEEIRDWLSEAGFVKTGLG